MVQRARCFFRNIREEDLEKGSEDQASLKDQDDLREVQLQRLDLMVDRRAFKKNFALNDLALLKW